jgi:uncharacterized protein YjaG (DUF416 family)
MEILSFNDQWLINKLDHMHPVFRTLFAAIAAERLFHAYLRYSRLTGRGNPKALGEALNRLWGEIAGRCTIPESAKETLEHVMTLIPREDDGPWVREQAWAEDAAAALAYAFRCRESGRSADAAWAARRVYEAIDHFVVTNNAIDTSLQGTNERVLSSPLVQSELLRQRRDIDELLADDADRPEIAAIAERMRQRAQIESKAIFDVTPTAL